MPSVVDEIGVVMHPVCL
uniref:Uncharacterized protein n=1 Tax=Arundo donax TaxID=35708 RepID=A0A0A9FJE1_ARUDO